MRNPREAVKPEMTPSTEEFRSKEPLGERSGRHGLPGVGVGIPPRDAEVRAELRQQETVDPAGDEHLRRTPIRSDRVRLSMELGGGD